jgi:hypothetical protein
MGQMNRISKNNTNVVTIENGTITPDSGDSMENFIEQDCTIPHNGQAFTSGGAVVTDARIVAYLGEDGVLMDWCGHQIGTYRVVSTWKTPHMSSMMSAVHATVDATVDGKLYKGRSGGMGMVFMGKVSACVTLYKQE